MSLRETPREPRDIPLLKIIPPELPARSQMDVAKLEELAHNIARNGVLVRLIVVPVGDRYEVVAGHRRLLAAERAGLVLVPCDVYASKDAALEAVKYAENRFREDMSPAEEAEYFAELLERECGGDIERLAVLVGEKQSYVDNRLQLFLGDPVIFEAVKDRKIPLGVAHQLNQITAEDYRRYYLSHAIKGGATVGVVSGWVAEWKGLYGTRLETPQPVVPVSVPVSTSTYDPRRCYICGKVQPEHVPESVSIHSHCKLAILDPLLEAYHGAPAAAKET